MDLSVVGFKVNFINTFMSYSDVGDKGQYRIHESVTEEVNTQIWSVQIPTLFPFCLKDTISALSVSVEATIILCHVLKRTPLRSSIAECANLYAATASYEVSVDFTEYHSTFILVQVEKDFVEIEFAARWQN